MKKTVTIKTRILSANDSAARSIRTRLTRNHTLGINIMASPGAGKTSIIVRTIDAFKSSYSLAVIDGDIVELDIETIKQTGIPVALADTEGACHLDAFQVKKALKSLPVRNTDLLIVENVGNLICPSHFDIGMHKNIVIASVPEGHDKPYKYPAIFRGADAVLLNKIDYPDFRLFDIRYFTEGIQRFEHDTAVFPLSAKTGQGMDAWFAWIKASLRRIKSPTH